MSQPNFFILGTTKGGTSSLHLWLDQHPDIDMTEPKELHYFCNCPNPRLHVARSFEDYLSRFGDAPLRGESSPCYLYDVSSIESIHDRFPDSAFVVSLRDPVERFWSHYLMNEVYRPTGLSPDEVLARNLENGHTDALTDLYGMGLYAEQIARCQAAVGPGRIHVTFLENLGRDPHSELRQILNFLQLPHDNIDVSVRDKVYVEPRGAVGRMFLRNRSLRKLGVALLPARPRRFIRTRVLGDPDRKPRPPMELVDRLRALYAPDCSRLEDLLGTDLPWDWHRGDRDPGLSDRSSGDTSIDV